MAQCQSHINLKEKNEGQHTVFSFVWPQKVDVELLRVAGVLGVRNFQCSYRKLRVECGE